MSEKNQLALKTASGNFQSYYINEVKAKYENLNLPLTQEETRVAIATMNAITKISIEKNIPFKSIDGSTIQTCIEVLMASGLNPTASKQIFFKPTENKNTGLYEITVEPQADGYITLLQKFGSNIQRYITTWVIREGDEFKQIEWVGIEQKPPMWKPKSTTAKVVRVIVIVQNADGTIDYSLQAERDNVIPSIIGHIRQNHRYFKDVDKVIEDIQKINDLDKILEKYSDYTYQGNKGQVYILGPSWRDHREAMIKTKMVNFACRQRSHAETKDVKEQRTVDYLVNEKTIDDLEEVEIIEHKKDVDNHFEEAKVVGKKFVESDEDDENSEDEINVDEEIIEPIEEVEEENVERKEDTQENEPSMDDIPF